MAGKLTEAARIRDGAAGIRPAVLREREAAAYLELSVHTLRAWRQGKKRIADGPPYVRLGKTTIRYRPADLDAWLEGRRVAADIKAAG